MKKSYKYNNILIILGVVFYSQLAMSFPIVAEKNFAMNCLSEYTASASIRKEYTKNLISKIGRKSEIISSAKLLMIGDQLGYLLFFSAKDEWTREELNSMRDKTLLIIKNNYINKDSDEIDKISTQRTKACDSYLDNGAKDKMLNRVLKNDEWLRFIPAGMQSNF
jgi:hypothetical protein